MAVALTQAIINSDPTSPNYLLQDLSHVYAYGDPRTYALSSYVYVILPTAANDQRMTTAKRQTLADFLYYSVCAGQREIGPIGYSPLPINLVQAGFQQIAQLKSADPNVDLTQRDVSTCNNPTFIAGQPNVNYLAEIAPSPAPCDHVGDGPCGEDGTSRGGVTAGGPGGGATAAGTGKGGSAAGSGSSGGSGGSGGSTDDASAVRGQHAIDAALRNPAEHALVSDTPARVFPFALRGRWAWEVLAALFLLFVLVGPWVVHRRAARRAGGGP